MAVKVGINGFGRIGRMAFQAICDQGLLGKQIDVVAVVDISTDADYFAYQMKYDSIHGKFKHDVKTEKSDASKTENDVLVVNGNKIKCVMATKSPADLPWKQLGVDFVIESTGLFTDSEKAKGHLQAGAKKVIISAPGKGEVKTLLIGVNENEYDASKHHIVSNASCTTNCLAPVAKILNDAFGIEKGLVTTVHSYTNDQNILDLPHKDLRRARAAAMSMIPTSTGAAKAVSLVLPELKGKLDGMAIRVPTPNVSVVDLVATLKKKTDADKVNAAFKKASRGDLKGILGFCEEPLVSIDFNGNPLSSIVDAPSTKVLDGNMVKVLSWYDNECGFSQRVVDLFKLVGK